jgi:outer membrane protein assembly factor BamB
LHRAKSFVTLPPIWNQGLRSSALNILRIIPHFPNYLLPNDNHIVATYNPAPETSLTDHPTMEWCRIGMILVILAIFTVGCGRDLGGTSSGWSPAAVSDDIVYVATTNGGEIKALQNNESGGAQVIWTFPSGGGQGIEGAYKTPVVRENLIYVSAIDGYLYALEKTTGTISERGWRRSVGDNQDPKSLVAGPALDPEGNVVVIGSEDGNLYAYDAKTGNVLWSFKTMDKIWSTSVIRDGLVFFGSHDQNVYALSLKDGQERWRFATGGAIVARPLLVNDTLVVGSFDKNLYGINIITGEKLWQIEGSNWFFTGAVARDGIIYAPSMDGNLYALNEYGNLLWKYQIGSPIVSTPTFVPRGIVVAGKDGRISLLDDSQSNIGPARELSSLLIRDTELKSPLVAQGHSVFVGAQDSTIRRIDVKNSQVQVWCFDSTKNKPCN